MINRRKKITLIQFTIFLVAAALLYNTYLYDESEKIIPKKKVETETDTNVNSFKDIEYSGFDLNGNRYTLNAGTADFKNETPEEINMKKVVANFYLKDDTILEVTSDEGLYNNITLDIRFEKNVKAVYLATTLLSNKLIYLNSDNKLLATGNVRGDSLEKGEFFADKVKYNLANKTIDLSMSDDELVKIKLKN